MMHICDQMEHNSFERSDRYVRTEKQEPGKEPEQRSEQE